MDPVQIDGGVDTHWYQPFPSVDSGEIHRKGLACCPRKHNRRKKSITVAQKATQYALFVIVVDILILMTVAHLHIIWTVLTLRCIFLSCNFSFGNLIRAWKYVLYTNHLFLYDTYEHVQV